MNPVNFKVRVIFLALVVACFNCFADDQLGELRQASAQQLFLAYQPNEIGSELESQALDQLLASEQWYRLAEAMLPKKLNIKNMENINPEVSQFLAIAEEHAKAANYLAARLLVKNSLINLNSSAKENKTENPSSQPVQPVNVAEVLMKRSNLMIENSQILAKAAEEVDNATHAFMDALSAKNGPEMRGAIEKANSALKEANALASTNPDAEALYELCIESNALINGLLTSKGKMEKTMAAEVQTALATLIDLKTKRQPKEREAYLKEHNLIGIKNNRASGLLELGRETKQFTVEKSTKTLSEWQEFVGMTTNK